MSIDLELHEARRTVRQFWGWANLCQCSSPELVVRYLHSVLKIYGPPGALSTVQFEFGWRADEQQWDPPALFVLYMLDAWELTDHGGSVHGGWLTADGIRLLEALDKVDPDTVFDEDWWEVEQLISTASDGLSEGEWKPTVRAPE